MSKPKSEELKEQGNVEFKKGSFLKAAGLYTKAIKEDPDNVLLYRYLRCVLGLIDKPEAFD